MARGRFISKDLKDSDKYIDLVDWPTRALYMHMVTFADAEGRLNGNSRWIKGVILTMLDYPNGEAGVQQSLQRMHDVGIIQWYEVDGKPYIQITKFHDHNKVRRGKDGLPTHESPSTIPAPQSGYGSTPMHLAEPLQSSDVAATAEVEVEVKDQVQVEVEGEVEVQDAPPPQHSEDNFDNLLNGSPTANDTHRVRATIRRLNADFAKRNEHQMQAWSRWTNQQIHEMWDAADPRKWPNEHDKKRSWIFADLLNEERQPPPKPYKSTVAKEMMERAERTIAEAMGEQ